MFKGARIDVDDLVEGECEEQDCAEKHVATAPDDHCIDHLPYRSWCPECVEGRATGEPHRSSDEGLDKPIVMFD